MRRRSAFALALALGACAGPPAPAPAAAGDVDFFEAAWAADRENAARQSLPAYLGHVRAFYAGSLLAPGWRRAQRRALEGLSEAEREALEPRFDLLGRLAAAEWAKDNAVRRLDSARLLAWSREIDDARRRGGLAATVERLIGEALDPAKLARGN